MFSRPDYVPLSMLWEEFLARKGPELRAIAQERYLSDGFSQMREFGSPSDFVEDIFLRTFAKISVSLCSPSNEVITVHPRSIDGGTSLFLKTSVFESSKTANDPEEAGKNGKWLSRMGSRYFEAWPHKLGDPRLWAAKYAHDGSMLNQGNGSDQLPYHTLPFCFERERFTIPQTLPPWCNDALDEVYVKFLVPDFLGHSICIDKSQAREWRSDNLNGSKYKHFLGDDQYTLASVGRPGKQQEAKIFFDMSFPDGRTTSWKDACNAIEMKFGLRVSAKTLRRAVDPPTKKGTK